MRQRLMDAGINVDTGISRFMGNEGLFLKFLGKFLQDTNFAGLAEAVKKQDVEEAFRCAHTLKGVCGNLSMDELYKLVSVQTEFFREGNPGDNRRTNRRKCAAGTEICESHKPDSGTDGDGG